MSDERKHIDNYFADSLGEHIDENLDLDLSWIAVEKGLNKYSFFRFQMIRFNIYYLVAICVNIAALCWVMTYKLEHPVVLESNVSSGLIDSNSGSSNSDVSIKSSSDNSKSIKTYSSHTKNPIQQNGIESNGADTSIVNNNNIIDKVGPSVEIFNSAELHKKPDSLGSKKIKPPVVISRKRDTIIQVDTLYINKKKKNKNK